ncbi:MAG: DUF1330 domain-containing protein [Desulfobacterales bacterium]|nr:DUF1330 domain-containing protein [Desulfobacterales bacterium]MBF0398321.1 DUF1330 domain-containing protein [Desulfobacterales bacterium]
MLNPTAEQFKALQNYPDNKPFIMINLLKFKNQGEKGDESGKNAYQRYALAVSAMLRKVGGRLLWMGYVEHLFIGMLDDQWDKVLLVEYPNKNAFIQMISAPEYEIVNKDREAGLEKAVLLMSTQEYRDF